MFLAIELMISILSMTYSRYLTVLVHSSQSWCRSEYNGLLHNIKIAAVNLKKIIIKIAKLINILWFVLHKSDQRSRSFELNVPGRVEKRFVIGVHWENNIHFPFFNKPGTNKDVAGLQCIYWAMETVCCLVSFQAKLVLFRTGPSLFGIFFWSYTGS